MSLEAGAEVGGGRLTFELLVLPAAEGRNVVHGVTPKVWP